MNENYILRCTKYSPFSLPRGGFYEFLNSKLREFGSHLALVDVRSEKQFTYSEVASLVERVTYHLYRHGVRRGDVFTLCAPNSVTYVILILALARLGAVFALLSAMSSTDELISLLSLANAKYLFTNEARSEDASRIISSTLVKGVFLEDKSAATLFEPIPSGETAPPVEKVLPDDVISILFSSGTSGFPKAVELTDKGFFCICLTTYEVGFAPEENNACVIFQPLAHIFGVGMVLVSLISGAHSVIMSAFDFKLYLQLVAKHKVNKIFVVPPVMVLLAKNPLVGEYDLSSVEEIFVGAAPVGAELEQQTRARLGKHVCIRQGYAMTESGLDTVTPPRAKQSQPAPVGTCGCVVPNSLLKVIDMESGAPLGPNKTGEICVKSDQIMKGYAGNPRATKETIDETGWLRTGDVGFYDENGYVFIVDRVKELIKCNAYQVAPAELEGLLLNHPDVADAGVIGLPDESRGELPHAWVVRKPGSTATEQDITDFVAGKVAPYKKLTGGVKFVSQIPKSSSGKILRRLMRSKMAASRSPKL